MQDVKLSDEMMQKAMELARQQMEDEINQAKVSQANQTQEPIKEGTDVEDLPTGQYIIETPKVKEDGIKLDNNINSKMTTLLGGLDQEIAKMEQETAQQREQDAQRQEARVKANEERAAKVADSQQVTILIDKLGMGKVEFTQEEKAKMEKVSKIKIEEVETIPLKSLKVKKKKSSLNKINERNKNKSTSSVIMPASGYTAVVESASMYELMNFFNSPNEADALESNMSRLEFLYKKIRTSSVPFSNFDDFLKSTAINDTRMLSFGILCATYPAESEITLKCNDENCGGTMVMGKKTNEYTYKYTPGSILVQDKIPDRLFDLMDKTITSSYVVEDALANHKVAPINDIVRFELPYSGFIVDVCIESAHDFLYNATRSIQEIAENKKHLAEAITTSLLVRSIFIYDEDEDAYDEYTSKEDISEIVYGLDITDIRVIISKISDITADISFTFGFTEVTCPYCGKVTEYIPFDPDEALFQQYRQAAQME